MTNITVIDNNNTKDSKRVPADEIKSGTFFWGRIICRDMNDSYPNDEKKLFCKVGKAYDFNRGNMGTLFEVTRSNNYFWYNLDGLDIIDYEEVDINMEVIRK